MIFVDTGAWFASVVPWDANHVAATTWLSQNQFPLITTDYIIDETLTLLRARNESARALILGEQFLDKSMAQLYFLDESDIRLAWKVFQGFADKDWSFTDCTSKIIIEKLAVKSAFAFDQHFRQFGSVRVEP